LAELDLVSESEAILVYPVSHLKCRYKTRRECARQ